MELPDIVSLGKPARFEWPDLRPWPYEREFGRYQLLRRIPSGPDDECYWGRLVGLAGFERFVFVRRFDAARLDDNMIDGFKRQGMIMQPSVAQVYDLGRIDEWGYIVGEAVMGASIVDLARSNARIPWLVALAIVHDVCNRLAMLRMQPDAPDHAITPARIKLASGEIKLCMGLPQPTPSWHHMVCTLVEPILGLAANPDERALLRELFSDENPDAVWVASDALVQRHPELDPVLPIVFLALAGRIDRTTAHATLVERVPVEQLRGLWLSVIDVAKSAAREQPVG